MSPSQVRVEIPERPIYVGGTGPTMATPTLLSSQDGDRGWKIVGMLELNNVSQYVISPKLNPAHRRAIKQEHIRSWISQRDVEAFDFAQTYSDSDLDWHAENELSEQPEKTARKGLAERVRDKGKMSVVPPRYDRTLAYQKSAGNAEGFNASRGEAVVGPKPGLNVSLKRKLSTSGTGSDLKRKHSTLVGEFFSGQRTQNTQPSLSSPQMRLFAMDEEDDDLEINEKLPMQPSSSSSIASQRLNEKGVAKHNISQSRSPLRELAALKPTPGNRVTRSRSSSVSVLPPHTRAESQMLQRSSPALQAGSQATYVAYESGKLQKETRITERQGSIASTVSSSPSQKQRKMRGHTRFTKVKNTKAARDKEIEWGVKAILEEELRQEKGKDVKYYKIDWEGEWEPTWEPESNVSADAIDEYQKRISSMLTEEDRPMLDEREDPSADSGEKSQAIATTEDDSEESSSHDLVALQPSDSLAGDANHTGKTIQLPLIMDTIAVLPTSRNREPSNQPRTPVSTSTDRESSLMSDFARFTKFHDEEEG